MISDDIPSVSITDKCIVLDLDQTLIATQDSIQSLYSLEILSNPKLIPVRNRTYYFAIEDLEKPGVGSKYDYWGITRPHLTDFLIFCFSYFRVVAVWSAGKRQYVEAIVDYIFKDIRPPHVVFSYDDTIVNGNRITKPLTKMFESNPALKRSMTLENTLVLDDNVSTFSENVENGILIPPFEPALDLSAMNEEDPTLLQFKCWLLLPEIANAEDVTKLNKEEIFSTPLSTYHRKLNVNPGYNLTPQAR